jgi:hypothetical protein
VRLLSSATLGSVKAGRVEAKRDCLFSSGSTKACEGRRRKAYGDNERSRSNVLWTRLSYLSVRPPEAIGPTPQYRSIPAVRRSIRRLEAMNAADRALRSVPSTK